MQPACNIRHYLHTGSLQLRRKMKRKPSEMPHDIARPVFHVLFSFFPTYGSLNIFLFIFSPQFGFPSIIGKWKTCCQTPLTLANDTPPHSICRSLNTMFSALSAFSSSMSMALTAGSPLLISQPDLFVLAKIRQAAKKRFPAHRHPSQMSRFDMHCAKNQPVNHLL